MRVLFVTNRGPRCGVAEFGKLWVAAARSTTHQDELEVFEWHADYPEYLPASADQYDLIHVNWHGGTVGHLLAQHIPDGIPLTVFFHESGPEWVGEPKRPLWARAQHRWVAEPFPGAMDPSVEWFPMPCPPMHPTTLPIAQVDPVLVGLGGLRRDGWDPVVEACRTLGWEVNLPGEAWLPMDQEVRRLARSTFNVAQYQSAWAGQSMGVQTMIAARRPLLVNGSRMLRQVTRDPAALTDVYNYDDFLEGAQKIMEEIVQGTVKYPLRLAERHWVRAAERVIVPRWLELGRGR